VARTVIAPDGTEWIVARRLTSRRAPRWRKVDVAETSVDAARLTEPQDITEILWWPVAVVAVVIVAVVLIPLLLFGIELILLGLLIAAGLLARTLLGRPWTVLARPRGDGGGELTWQASGWRGSREVIEEVSSAIAAGLAPAPLAARSASTVAVGAGE